MSDLKPCPKCQSERITIISATITSGNWQAFASCDECGCRSQMIIARTEKGAIEVLTDWWNARAPESGWMPIETAPKDGTPIKVLYADGLTEEGVWWQAEGRCCVLGSRAGSLPSGWTSTEAGNLPVDDITHWQPLYAPPESEASNG